MSRENPFSLQPNNARLYAKYDSNIPKYKNIIDEKFPHKENDKDSSNDNKTCILPKSSSLLRLFNSEMFSVSMAIHYLFSSKEQGVIMYLGNKLFQFDPDETLFYMPQLLSLSFMSSDVALSVYTYVIVRSQECAQSHLTCIVILNSFTNRHQKMHHKAIILKKKLITLDVSEFKYSKNSNCLFDPEYKKSHQRSQSDFSIPNSFTDLSKVPLNTHTPQKNVKTVNSNCYYFDETCTCNVGQIRDLKSRKSEAISAYNYNKKIPIDQCVCPGLLIRPQIRFINAIIDIGNRLQTIQSPHLRTSYLINELNKINKALPARVWVPFDHLNPHHIVNVPPLSSSLLKSSDNAPFLIYIEVVECDNLLKSPLPQIANNPMRMVQSVDNVNTLSDASSVPSLYDQKPADTLSKHSFKPDYRSHTRHVSINNTIISSSLALDSLSLTSYDSYLSTDNNEINGGSIVGSSLNSNYFSPSRVRDNLLVNVGQKVNLSQSQEECVYPNHMVDIHESWSRKYKQLRRDSPFSCLPGWKIYSMIIKYGDELQQEVLAYQFMTKLQSIWKCENVPLTLSPCKVFVVTEDAGFIQPATNVLSLHELRKHIKSNQKLIDYFYWKFGDENSKKFLDAKKVFTVSCAAYCILCYLLEVKDRHNGNILLASDGRLIHIDFAYILSLSPGQNIGFELSPFKLTSEFVEVIGGMESSSFEYFKDLIVRGLMAVRKHSEDLISIIEPLQFGSNMACFNSQYNVVELLEKRFFMFKTEDQIKSLVHIMIQNSISSYTTKLYDNFQYYSNGIL